MSRHLDDLTTEISDRLSDLACEWIRLGIVTAADTCSDAYAKSIAQLRRVYAEDLGDAIVTALADGWQLEEISETTDLEIDQVCRFPGVPEELDTCPV